jgi:hypothetical protein
MSKINPKNLLQVKLDIARAPEASNYLLHLIAALVICVFIAGISYFRGTQINIYSLVFSFVFGLAFVPLVVVKLPVFNSYYDRDIYSFDRRCDDLANRKAAPVMVSLVTGVALTLLFYINGFDNLELPSFCGAVAAGVISFYYEPRFY